MAPDLFLARNLFLYDHTGNLNHILDYSRQPGPQKPGFLFICSEGLIPYYLAYLPDSFRGAFPGLLRSCRNDLCKVFVIGAYTDYLFADRFGKLNYILSKLFFHVAVADLARGMLICEIFNSRMVGDHIHNGKQVFDRFGRFFSRGFGSLVGNCPHNLFTDILGSIGKEDAIAFALAHLAGAVEARYLEQLLPEVIRIGFGEIFYAIHSIETAGKAAGHLEVLLLVLAHWHLGSAVDNDIGSHKNGVSKKACVDVIGLSAYFLLERSGSLELSYISIHVKKKIKLEYFGDIALNKYGSYFGVDSAGEVFGKNLLYVALDIARFGVSS